MSDSNHVMVCQLLLVFGAFDPLIADDLKSFEHRRMQQGEKLPSIMSCSASRLCLMSTILLPSLNPSSPRNIPAS